MKEKMFTSYRWKGYLILTLILCPAILWGRDSLSGNWSSSRTYMAVRPAGGTTAMLIFHAGSSTWSGEHLRNQVELEHLIGLLSRHRNKLNRGEACLRLVSYVQKKDVGDTAVESIALRQAATLENYLCDRLPWCRAHWFRTVLDSTENISDRVSCEWWNHPREYLEEETPERMSSYAKGLRILAREDYLLMDHQGNLDSARMFQYDLELERRRFLEPLVALSYRKLALAVPEHAVLEQPQMEAVDVYYPRFSIKTDILLWAFVVPNLSLEYYFQDRWSVSLHAARKGEEYLYSSADARYWPLQKKTFRYLFVGAEIGYGQYNLRKNAAVARSRAGQFMDFSVKVGTVVPIYRGWAMEASTAISYICQRRSGYVIQEGSAYEVSHSIGHDCRFRYLELKLLYRFGKKLKRFRKI